MIGKHYASFSEWLRDHPEPSLQELVDRWGGYSRVPVEAWQRFDADMKAWQQAYRRRHEGEQNEEGRWPRADDTPTPPPARGQQIRPGGLVWG